jgi:UDP-N-acetylmuramoylalanine--D-glutamate ligase
MDNFKSKKVLVFGLGLNNGGVGSAKFFADQGAQVRITDLKDSSLLKSSLDQLKKFPKIEYALGKHKNEDIDWADLIIKNPGVKIENPFIKYALSKGKSVEQDMGIFLQFIKPSQIIGVTGTKGKSTTSSLIFEILRNSGKKVVLAGNIGNSVLDYIEKIDKNTFAVLELSSFQLESFDKHRISPKWAIITNIYPDHLNYYKNITEYILAKKVIAKYQSSKDFIFINKDDLTIYDPRFLEGLVGQIIYYSQSDLPKNFSPILKGKHNTSNIAGALSVCRTIGIDEEIILKVASNFKGVPFRMELIKNWNGIKIYNDTTATNPDASIKAMQTLRSHLGSGNRDGGLMLICGGMNKNMPYDNYAKAVEKYARKVFFLQGDSTEEIKKLMKNQDLIAGEYNNLEKLLKDVKACAKAGDIILFSPASTSFNLFQNEFDRGRKFNSAVGKIFI